MNFEERRKEFITGLEVVHFLYGECVDSCTNVLCWNRKNGEITLIHQVDSNIWHWQFFCRTWRSRSWYWGGERVNQICLLKQYFLCVCSECESNLFYGENAEKVTNCESIDSVVVEWKRGGDILWMFLTWKSVSLTVWQNRGFKWNEE